MPPYRPRLRHIHIPCDPSSGRFPSYKTAAALQELLRRRLLDYKDALAAASPASPAPPRPPPTLLSFTPEPTYTLGRRQGQHPSSPPSFSQLTPPEIARLKAPLRVRARLPLPLPGAAHPNPDPAEAAGPAPPTGTQTQTQTETETEPGEPRGYQVFHPAVLASPRGGLATYHGPGQVVLWPVLEIRASWRGGRPPLGHRQFTVRAYARLLEATTIALLRRLFGIRAFTTEDPGVWVRSAPAGSGSASDATATTTTTTTTTAATTSSAGAAADEEQQPQGPVRKISALGVHLRRNVSSLGAAINLDMPTTTTTASASASATTTTKTKKSRRRSPPAVTEAEATNPWSRFQPCGLEGMGVTCVAEELRAAGGLGGVPGLAAAGDGGEVVARAWAEELARGMWLLPAASATTTTAAAAAGREGAARGEGGVEWVGSDEVAELVRRAEREGYLEAMSRDEL